MLELQRLLPTEQNAAKIQEIKAVHLFRTSGLSRAIINRYLANPYDPHKVARQHEVLRQNPIRRHKVHIPLGMYHEGQLVGCSEVRLSMPRRVDMKALRRIYDERGLKFEMHGVAVIDESMHDVAIAQTRAYAIANLGVCATDSATATALHTEPEIIAFQRMGYMQEPMHAAHRLAGLRILHFARFRHNH